MISLYTILVFLFFHWVFDFHLQTPQMAERKSHDNFALAQHCGVYWIGLLFMGLLNYSFFKTPEIGITCFVVINWIVHFCTDWVTSRATSALYKDQRFHDFFVVIGFDQMLHFIMLFLTFVWATNL